MGDYESRGSGPTQGSSSPDSLPSRMGLLGEAASSRWLNGWDTWGQGRGTGEVRNRDKAVTYID